MHCFVCYDCLSIITERTLRCPMCKSINVHYDRYGMIRRLIVNCISSLTEEEVASIAKITGCPDMGHNDMYRVIGGLIN